MRSAKCTGTTSKARSSRTRGDVRPRIPGAADQRTARTGRLVPPRAVRAAHALRGDQEPRAAEGDAAAAVAAVVADPRAGDAGGQRCPLDPDRTHAVGVAPF